MKLAPIALFVYKRPWHTQRTLESLAANEGAAESELFIFCDGPKRPEDAKAVEDVRELVRSRQWCGKVNIIERDKNLGLANSIISGVTELCDKYGRVIVLEDDLVLTPHFLSYMNQALNRYENEVRVMHISSFMFKLKGYKPETFFLRFPGSWGWATWGRAWKYFNSDTQYLLDKVAEKGINDFIINGKLGSYKMLQDQKDGKVDSWAVRWYASIYLSGGLALYPGRSLLSNIGHDGTGTHCGDEPVQTELTEKKIEVRDIPLREDPFALRAVLKARKPALFDLIKAKIQRVLFHR